MKTAVKGSLSAVVGVLAFGLMLFLPAGTTHYWQGWAFLAVFALSTWMIGPDKSAGAFAAGDPVAAGALGAGAAENEVGGGAGWAAKRTAAAVITDRINAA